MFLFFVFYPHINTIACLLTTPDDFIFCHASTLRSAHRRLLKINPAPSSSGAVNRSIVCVSVLPVAFSFLFFLRCLVQSHIMSFPSLTGASVLPHDPPRPSPPQPLLVSLGQSQWAALLRHRHPDPAGPLRPCSHLGSTSRLGSNISFFFCFSLTVWRCKLSLMS